MEVYLCNLEIVKGSNIFLSKKYLQRFYTNHKPNWVNFCEKLLNSGYIVLLYLSINTESKYITVVKNNKMLKIRYSNHPPNFDSFNRSDIKFYIGPCNKGMYGEEDIMNCISLYFKI